MNEQILINVTPQETRVAIMEQGAVQEVHVERASNRGLVGNIYLGRVGRVLPGMQSAFIEIGLSRAAFLHVADIWAGQKNAEGQHANHKPLEQKPIEKLLHEGQTLVVQVIKDPIGSKFQLRAGYWFICRAIITLASPNESKTRLSASSYAKKCMR
jgi:ribonuclease G